MTQLPAIHDQRVATFPPRASDQYVVTLVDGRPATFDAVARYDAALARAEYFLCDRQCRMMVLPMTERELENLFGFDPALANPERFLVIRTLTRIVRDGRDAKARRDACDLLVRLGVLRG